MSTFLTGVLALMTCQFIFLGSATTSHATTTIGSGACASTIDNSTGVTVTTVGSDCVVTFTSTSTENWTTPAGVTKIELLLVGGGGGGDRGTCAVYWGHGGGGGQVLDLNISVAQSTSYAVAVGAGGAGDPGACSTGNGSNGSASTFSTYSAAGGYAAASYDANPGGYSGLKLFAGGTGTTGNYPAGGGGGAGGAGSDINGGPGINSSITGTTIMYGSGGAGKNDAGFGTAYPGGAAGSTPTANEGGGGSDLYPYTSALAGANGVVIVRYTPVSTCTPTSSSNGYLTVLQFTQNGGCNWTVPANISNVSAVLVGGGGGGGSWVGGGGGGGGFVLATNLSLTPGSSQFISVGMGGIGSIQTAGGLNMAGTNGSASTALGLTAYGGGSGASWTTFPTGSSATSGGAAYSSGNGGPVAVSASISPAQGYAGGNGTVNGTYGYPTGGGGGAGGLGGNGVIGTTTGTSGSGGAGASTNITGSTLYFGGGGGGGCHGNGTYTCIVGSGVNGGGNGAGNGGTFSGSNIIYTGGNGTANTGGGGGGAGCPSTNTTSASSQGGNGGSGIIIISYDPRIAQTLTFTSSTPTSAKTGGNYIVTTSSSLPAVITIDTSTSANCTIAGNSSGSTVSFVAAGSCVIDANQSGNSSYLPVSQIQMNFSITTGSVGVTLAFTGSTYQFSHQGDLQITVNLTGGDSLVTFYYNKKKIYHCVNIQSSGLTATCNWKPTAHGFVLLTATAVPNNSNVNSNTSIQIPIFISPRTAARG